MGTAAIALNSKNFEALIQERDIVFLDFWAPWCAPCKDFGVIFEKVAAENPEITFAKVNIEEEQEFAEIFHIRSIPHLMIFKKGIAIYSEAGSMPKSLLLELVEQAKKADVSQIQDEMEE